VFMSIFKGGRNARYDIKEGDLVKAMVALGFEFTSRKGGSRRAFTPSTAQAVEAFGNTPYVYHIHEKVLDTHRQDLIKKDLGGIYKWAAESFELVAPPRKGPAKKRTKAAKKMYLLRICL
ncbi:hypothetical protein L227DRAFT_568199, partial [Lentinus tigrinus ALCF2SS1-6]